ncbi:MAG: VCBS repeat-containing protein, partial [Verrucomicrobia bacterium]|nr:VCBS repeat-containing protein [Verrucomicrobiota bacterium]
MNRRDVIRCAGIVVTSMFAIGTVFAKEKLAEKKDAWKQYVGKPGPSGWRCHVVQADPRDHGPDGINIHDWDKDGHHDLFVNFEEGKYSRLYFNPGPKKVRRPWTDFIEF